MPTVEKVDSDEKIIEIELERLRSFSHHTKLQKLK